MEHQRTSPELETGRRDDGHGLTDWNQRNEFERPSAVEFGNRDFVAYAGSFGLAGFRPATADDLYPTLMRALEVPGPAVVEVPSTTVRTSA
jgi:acetolactate synthase I/II/III large subunit